MKSHQEGLEDFAPEPPASQTEPADLDRTNSPPEERFRRLVETIPAIVYVETDERPFPTTYISPRIQDALGYAPEEFVGDRSSWSRLVHPDDLDLVRVIEARSNQTREPYIAEYRLLGKDGGWHWFRDEAVFIEDEAVWQGVMVDITREKEAELRARELDALYRNLIEQMPAVTYVDLPDGALTSVYVSPQVESMLGVKQEDVTSSEQWLSRVHPDDREHALRGTQEGVASKEPFSLEYRMIRPDGREIWVRDQASVVLDDEGDPSLVQGVLFDITEQKRIEEEFRTTAARFRTLIEQIPAVTYIEWPDAPGHASYMSPQYQDLMGYTPEERVADPEMWTKLLHPEDRDRELARAAEALATGEPFASEYRMIAKDGHTIWVRDGARPVRDPDGTTRFWQGVMFDISEQKRLEQELHDTATKYRTILEQLPAIVYIDPVEPGPVPSLYVSPRIEMMLGVDPESARSDPNWWLDLLHPDDRERVSSESDRTDITGEPFNVEYRMVGPNGREIWVHDEAVLVKDADGKPLFWHGMFHDITEQVHIREELQRALAREREAAEIKDTFLRAVSHDLRSPLTAILGNAVTLEQEEELDLPQETRRQLAHSLSQKARKLTGIVSDLLDMDRITRGGLEPRLVPVDLGGLIQRVVRESEALAGRRVCMDLQSLTLAVDPSMVERIIENLLGNAAKHTTRDATVWIRLIVGADGAIFAVEDDGPGVPEEIRDTLFGAFERGTSAEGTPGLGLGLSIVARFAEQHGGRAWVQEREGGGASFRVLLPFGPATSL